jgi:hypothetical protein
MEEQKQNSQVFFYLNATIQLCAVFAFQQLAVIWPFYIVMAMICIVIAIQTLGASVAFSGFGLTPPASKVIVANTAGINVLISLLYMVSSYHIYLIGFVGFAWVAATHSVIHLLTNLMGASKNDSSSVHHDL